MSCPGLNDDITMNTIGASDQHNTAMTSSALSTPTVTGLARMAKALFA
jgi:hypothetical protein